MRYQKKYVGDSPLSSRRTDFKSLHKACHLFPHMSHLHTKNVYREPETNFTCWKSTKAFNLEIMLFRIHREDGSGPTSRIQYRDGVSILMPRILFKRKLRALSELASYRVELEALC